MRFLGSLTLLSSTLLFVNVSRSAPVAAMNGVFPKASLTVKLGVCHVAGKGFADVISELNVKTDQNILVNWRALEAAHVIKDLPVTVDLSGLMLSQALDRLLDRVGGVYVRLGYAVDDNAIIISTPVELATNVSTRVYDIRSAI